MKVRAAAGWIGDGKSWLWAVALGAAVTGCARGNPPTSAGDDSPPLEAAQTADPAVAPAPSPVPTGADAAPKRTALGSVRIDGVPHQRQKPDFCGEADAAMALTALGKRWSQDQVFAASGMDPARGMGATTRELKTALEHIGFRVGPVWHHVGVLEADRGMERMFAGLHADLERKVPSIVCMRYDDQPRASEHFRLVLGYDADTKEVLYHEPAESDGAYRRMKLEAFLALWPLKYERSRWTVIRFRLEPGELREPPPHDGNHSPADFAQHVMKLQRGLPPGFTIVVEPPFVVLGDEQPAMVRKRAASTVRWAVHRLKKAYFSKDPNRILNIWLFRDDRSYRHHARAFFGEDPQTPYGYYSDRHRALVMNISTGGGTLVHEIVHPFVESNFPDCPAWFNEGLGSLYEQSSSRNGQIVGLTNWRLAGLQRAIAAGAVPSFERLTATTSHQFYEQDPGTNYAQARYLLYYLQEKGLLHRYYHEFYRSRRKDPTGYRTLQRVLGTDDMKAFQKSWEAYVSKLRFP
ncbi:MAG: C39 family peptidase [Deltaproteobacteria bacterium]|jgi:hypothetical protein|nr:C39 family peptidase [Deltaproteobacteria bacterium]MBW2530020.1 C39 family peptidase [Deltaproteobacteria bacterium]